MNEDTAIPGPLNNVIRIDDDRIKGHLDRVVRGTVEETLNALLDAEADRLCNAQRYERTEARRDTRAGHYERNLETKAGEVTLKVPKLRRQTVDGLEADWFRPETLPLLQQYCRHVVASNILAARIDELLSAEP